MKMIDTKLTNANSTSHDLAVLSADELDAVTGGGGTPITFEVPYSVGIYMGVAAAGAAFGTLPGAAMLACAAMVGADGLLNAWAENKMSNVRKSN
jgi:hypothetical protein